MALFVTCLVDAFYPEVGESVVRVLRRLGISVAFPLEQLCCGQPAFNAGHQAAARAVAEGYLRAFEPYEEIVGPSGSCVAMVRHYLPQLFADDPKRLAQARALAARTFEFTEFLVRRLGVEDLGARFAAKATYHASCHMSRGLEVRDEPRRLLSHVRDLELIDLPYVQDCCGFGGTFAVKMGPVSEAMGQEKVNHIRRTGAEVLIGSDMACLMHLGGRLSRIGAGLEVLHIAQVLDRGMA
ncbi:MAG TPA: (Fe-S)-binding protein [Limnochordia bacterium]